MARLFINRQKGFTSIVLVVLVVAIVAIGAYFASTGKSPDVTSQAPVPLSNIPLSTTTSTESTGSVQSVTLKQDHQVLQPQSTTQSFKKETIFPQQSKIQIGADVVQGHPVNCFPRLGFDNHRTEQAFVINPRNNKEMYVNIEYKGVYKSMDGGNAWNFSGSGLKGLPRNDDPSKPCYELRFHLYIDPSNPQRVLAPGGSAPGKVGEGLGGLSESLYGGKSWHQLFTSEMSAYTESVAI